MGTQLRSKSMGNQIVMNKILAAITSEIIIEQRLEVVLVFINSFYFTTNDYLFYSNATVHR